MKRIESKLAQQQAAQNQAASQAGPLEFATAEEMLRFDAQNTEVPKAVEERLRDSLTREPLPPRRWWQRLFKRS
jgi:hypothetical protein